MISGPQRRPSHIMRELNLVPLIDVLLVVLFFYMIISPMMSRGLDVNLPRSASNTIKPEDRVVLTVTRRQEVFVEKERVSVARLEDVLRSLRRSKPQVNVYLRADKDAPYGAVVQVMDMVKRAGIDKLGMVTEAAPPGGAGGR
jgi:biopolymer transport protein TolR